MASKGGMPGDTTRRVNKEQKNYAQQARQDRKLLDKMKAKIDAKTKGNT